MHVFKKWGVLKRNCDQTYTDSKQQVINGEYLEWERQQVEESKMIICSVC